MKRMSSRLSAMTRVSMESGLEGRNNEGLLTGRCRLPLSLNGVRPRRPEQSADSPPAGLDQVLVSMESGLEGRNNGGAGNGVAHCDRDRLNGVRPRRPEQCAPRDRRAAPHRVSMESGLEGRNNSPRKLCGRRCVRSLNGVRPRRPEQWPHENENTRLGDVSMESGLEGRNNAIAALVAKGLKGLSQWSPA